MALSDPLAVDVAGTDVNFPRVDVGTGKSVYRIADGSKQATISHSSGKRDRTAIRLDSKKIAADPLVTTLMVPLSMSCTLVIDTPKVGFSLAEQKGMIDSLIDLLTRSSGANLTKILGGES